MEKTITLQPFQWRVLESNKPYLLALAGKRGGKSFVGAIWAAKKISEYPQKNGLIAAPTYKILQQATLDIFFNLFPQYRHFYKQQQSLIELPSGGKIYIRSTDEPLGLEGMTLKWAWLDEAGMMNRLVWDIIRTRLAFSKGQLLLTTSPHYINWLYTEFYLKWLNKEDEDLEVVKWKTIDNKYFDKNFLEKEKNRLSSQEFARYYEAEFMRMSGLVYSIRDNQIIEKLPFTTRPDTVIAGIDWGFNNPSAIAVIYVKDKEYFLVDEFYQTNKTTEEILQAAKILDEKHHINEWYPDPAEPDRIEEMKRKGFYVKDTNKNIKFGISKLQQLINENRFYVLKSCQNAIDEFNYYHYDENATDPKKKELPVKEMDHMMDAIRYAVVGCEPISRGLMEKIKLQIVTNRRDYQNKFE